MDPIERGAHVVNLSLTKVVFAMAQSGTAKIEAQHWKAETVQSLHGVKDDLVVKRPTKEWMRMAHHRGISRVVCARVQKRFQSTRWTLQED